MHDFIKMVHVRTFLHDPETGKHSYRPNISMEGGEGEFQEQR